MENFIAKNIKFLRGLKKLSQEDLAEDLKITRAQVSTYERESSAPSIPILLKLSKYFEIPIDILIKNDISKAGTTSFIELRNKRVLFPISVDEDNENLIEVVPVKASAGYLAGYDDPEYIEQLQKIKLPFLPSGKHRAFPIRGDSMLPMKDGSFVIGKFVEDKADIKTGRTYVLVTTNDGMVYKRVTNTIDKDQCLILNSDNKFYESYKIHVDEVLEAWEFTCSINTQEYSKEELKISSILNMFNELGIELEALKRK
jgi:transcriptional regulator with XRE-family HTH domain